MSNNTPEKRRILIIDDALIYIHLLEDILISKGYDVVSATSGKQGIAAAEELAPDLILLDIVMPDTDGFEVCKILKKNYKLKNIPVIFLTGERRDNENIVRGFETGAADYITKPFQKDVLLARIHTHLKLKITLDGLESMIEKRTADILYSYRKLEEVHTALTVLLEKRETDRHILEEQIMSNVKRLILPFLENLRQSHLSNYQRQCTDIIESRISQITSLFSKRLSSSRFNLTQTEIQTAALIKSGCSSKQISDMLNISEHTVIFHRNNIRKKFGLVNKKVSLSSYLNSIED